MIIIVNLFHSCFNCGFLFVNPMFSQYFILILYLCDEGSMNVSENDAVGSHKNQIQKVNL